MISDGDKHMSMDGQIAMTKHDNGSVTIEMRNNLLVLDKWDLIRMTERVTGGVMHFEDTGSGFEPLGY